VGTRRGAEEIDADKEERGRAYKVDEEKEEGEGEGEGEGEKAEEEYKEVGGRGVENEQSVKVEGR
jgi:hypothetical protein